jgi:predicted nucleic acid-binding protein
VPENILVDTGPLVALFDKDDAYHQTVTRFIRTTNYAFISTTAVLTEVLHLLDFNIAVQLDFLEWVMRGGIMLYDVVQSDIPKITALTRQYSDRPMDFADATLLIAAEATGIRKIISLDSDFDIYRLTGNSMLDNVLRSNNR